MSESIKQILMRRDNLSVTEAEDLITNARKALIGYLNNDDQDAAENICQEYFGLEMDYIIELI